MDYGDWVFKNKFGKLGGWVFEFMNCFYLDIDDMVVVVMVLDVVELFDEDLKGKVIVCGMEWIVSM